MLSSRNLIGKQLCHISVLLVLDVQCRLYCSEAVSPDNGFSHVQSPEIARKQAPRRAGGVVIWSVCDTSLPPITRL